MLSRNRNRKNRKRLIANEVMCPQLVVVVRIAVAKMKNQYNQLRRK